MDKDTKAAVIAALKFYSDERNYEEWETSGVISITCDGGDRARDTLELIKREGDENMSETYKTRLIGTIGERIGAQQAAIDALERGVMNNRFCNVLEVATERQKETRAIRELIEREGDEIKDTATLSAAFLEIVDRTLPDAAFLYEDFHHALETALIMGDVEERRRKDGMNTG